MKTYIAKFTVGGRKYQTEVLAHNFKSALETVYNFLEAAVGSGAYILKVYEI